MADKFGLGKVRDRIVRVKRELPIQVANLTQNHFTESFSKGSLDEHKWAEVKRRIPGTYEYKYPKNKGLSRRTSPILVRKAILRKRVSRSIMNAQWANIRLVVDLPYAKAQNEGNENIPARPYMIHTSNLGKKQQLLIRKTLDKLW